MHKIKVMVVDDSAVIRQVMTDIIKSDNNLELVAAVADPVFAMARMEKEWPEVIVLDVEMPRMDGISFLRKIMAERPTPVVMCSTLTEKGAETTMQALSSGAVDIITKPKSSAKGYLLEESTMVLDAIKSAAKANMKRVMSPRAGTPSGVAPKLSADAILSASHGTAMKETTERLVAIGTSTGGTQALEQILVRLPRVSPGIVVVQHMPEKFTSAFASRLNSLCEVEVKEAANMDRVLPGRVLIAPGGKHMMLKRNGAYYHVEVVDGPLVSRHRPSVDVLFRSMAKYAGANALGVIMTGMGDDGAVGLKEMHEAGAETIAQDEASCIVFGMPKEAIKRGGVDHIMPLDAIPQAMLDFAGRKKINVQ